MPRTIVISYSHEDERWKDRLTEHLALLRDYCSLRDWNDRQINVGADWEEEIEKAFREASAAIFLISPSFLSSKYIQEKEIPWVLERRTGDQLHIFPIYIRPVDFGRVPWLSGLQLYPRDDRALSELTHSQVDRGLATLTQQIADVLDLSKGERDRLWQRTPGTWPDFRRLAELLIEEIPAEERQWPAIRWKTLYSISLRQRLGPEGETLPLSVISAIRQGGGLICDALEQRKEDARKYFEMRIAPNGHSFARYPWFEKFAEQEIDAGKEVLSSIRDRARWARKNRPEDFRLGGDELAHVFFWECLVFAIFELRVRRGLRHAKFILEQFPEDVLKEIAQMTRHLTMINSFRDADAFAPRKLPKGTSSLEASDIVSYLLSSPDELDYLTRWQELLSVVMINDDARRASQDYGGPFPTDDKLDQSYRVFAQKGAKRGVPVLVSHFCDLPPGPLVGKQFAAWDLVGNQWKRRKRWTTEFFFDKFPSSRETRRLRQSLQREPRIRIWNKVTFTKLIADKWRVHKLLDDAGVRTLGPCFPVDLKPTKATQGPSRQEIVDSIRKQSSQKGYEFAENEPCIVIKPRTAWQGKGAQRLTPDQFLSKDLSGDEVYSNYNGAVAQPFYESRGRCPLDGVSGRHDIRLVIVGPEAVFGMIRDLGDRASENEWVASLENVKRLRGTRTYVSKQNLLRRRELSDVIGAVSSAINDKFHAMPSILSIDVVYVTQMDVRVVELNSKPSQVWEPGDNEGAHYVQLFQDSILDEFAKLYEDYRR